MARSRSRSRLYMRRSHYTSAKFNAKRRRSISRLSRSRGRHGVSAAGLKTFGLGAAAILGAPSTTRAYRLIRDMYRDWASEAPTAPKTKRRRQKVVHHVANPRPPNVAHGNW